MKGAFQLENATYYFCDKYPYMWVCCSTEVIFNVSRATALELRSRHNNKTAQGDYTIGASCWSPVVNVMRDPRWGRNQVMDCLH